MAVVIIILGWCHVGQVMRVADSGAHFLAHHLIRDGTFTVLADRDTAAGDQLFEDYGDNDNAM